MLQFFTAWEWPKFLESFSIFMAGISTIRSFLIYHIRYLVTSAKKVARLRRTTKNCPNIRAVIYFLYLVTEIIAGASS